MPKKKGRIALWAGASAMVIVWCLLPLVFGPAVVPYPWTVAARLVWLLAAGLADGRFDQTLFFQMLLTTARTLCGFGLALLVGTALGFVSGRYLIAERALFVPVSVIQGAPPLLWIVPLVLIIGGSGFAPVGVVFFVVLPLVVIGVQEGMRTLQPASLEMMRVYAPGVHALVREIYLPGLAGHFRAIILSGLLIGLKSSIIGEWFGAEAGIGSFINRFFYNFDMPSFYATAAFYVGVTAVVAWAAGSIGSRVFTRRRSSIDPADRTAMAASGLIRKRKRAARLEIMDVTFAFGSNIVCRGLSFALGAGRTAVLTGESGVGKTTLARLALGLLKPKTGRVCTPERARLLFQEDVFLFHRDCFGNVAIAVPPRHRLERGARSMAALRAVGLEEQAGLFPDELSGGMKKRLALARALAADPDFIIMDEPFNKLHKKARRELWELSFTLFAQKGVPMLIITHFPEDIGRRKGVEYYEMRDGKMNQV